MSDEHKQTIQTVKPWQVHEQRVVTNDGKALQYRAVCTCGWRSPRRWASWGKADIEASDHAEIAHEEWK